MTCYTLLYHYYNIVIVILRTHTYVLGTSMVSWVFGELLPAVKTIMGGGITRISEEGLLMSLVGCLSSNQFDVLTTLH